MKRIMTRSYMILLIALLFVGGMGFLAFRIVTQSADWVQQTYNGHISITDGITGTGEIYDRNGTKLAYTDDSGVRMYHDNISVRESLLHVLGDKSMGISTAIQSMYRADLSGYSFIFGMGLPSSIKGDSSVTLTVDAEACGAAYDAMGGLKGACIIYNYKTGEVLCSVSTPTYDPADPPAIDKDNEAQYDGVYLDNVLSSTFTPGSIFKIITAAAAMENIPDIDKRTFTCEGSYEVLGKTITCEHAHGEMTFEEAFAHSCNCAFAQIAIEVGGEKLKKTAEEFGFNHRGYTLSGIPLAVSTYDAVGAGDNYLAWSGIGQYTDLANPAHYAMICAAIANGGTAVSPYIVEDDGSLMSKLGIRNNQAGDVKMISADTAARLKKLMQSAAEGYGVDIAGLKFYAKTGTAELGTDEYGNKRTNAWFVGFTEDKDHPYAFAVIRVDGGYGIESYYVINAAISELVYKSYLG